MLSPVFVVSRKLFCRAHRLLVSPANGTKARAPGAKLARMHQLDNFYLNYFTSRLQNALQQISSWMTANLLTLNCSKTEFFLI